MEEGQKIEEEEEGGGGRAGGQETLGRERDSAEGGKERPTNNSEN